VPSAAPFLIYIVIEMKKVLIVAIGILLGVVLTKFVPQVGRIGGVHEVQQETSVITKSIARISKLMVAEGHFSEVLSHRDKKSYFYDFFEFEKKAILLVDAKVLVGYDLSQMSYNMDEATRTVFISALPEPEVEIIPDVRFYDIQDTDFHKFTPGELNDLNKQAVEAIKNRVDDGDLIIEAQEKVLESMGQIQLVIESLGWTLEMHPQIFEGVEQVAQ